MLRPQRKRWFLMPPAETPPANDEPSATFDVYAVLRDHLRYTQLIHAELRQQRRHRQELEMKVSELSSKVDTLIGVATDLKGRVDAGASNTSPGSPVVTQPEDDPEVEALAHRIDDAIAVLRGDKEATDPNAPTPTVPPPNQIDPNAPPADPTPPMQPTNLNDPNAAV